MTEISGDFETHITVLAADRLEGFAREHGLKFVHIELGAGSFPSQPMLTLRGSGTLREQVAVADEWVKRLRAEKLVSSRTKIEAVPWAEGVPVTDEDAEVEPVGRHFEHHVKLLLAGDGELEAVTAVAERHEAKLSRNARRQRDDGTLERFVNQRCYGVGRETAAARLELLVAELRGLGLEIASVEQEYVVHDDNIRLDRGWLADAERADRQWEVERRTAPAGERDYPATYQPLKRMAGVTQRAAFDPASKHFSHAYRPGEPVFRDTELGQRWLAARAAAMNHVLGVVARSGWADHLVLRGSVVMRAWVGDAARVPGDLDFVVTPRSITSRHPTADRLLREIVAGIAAEPGAGLRPEATTRSDIWTYERADGRRLVVPFRVAGVPDGNVQIDVVFGEELPIPPEPIALPGVPGTLLAATAELSLAWKLLWLSTDSYPQGKDLYDAVLLAEHTTADLGLARELMRPELGDEADAFGPDTVWTWARDVDWANFADEYPLVEGTAEQWVDRLARALDG